MAQTTVNIRIDKDTKIAFDKFCKEIGLSSSAAFNLFAKTVVREQRIPFAIEIPNANTKKAINNARIGKSLSKEFKTVDEVINNLNA